MPNKKQEECLKRLKAAKTATFSDFIIPMPKICDKEKKTYWSDCMRRSKEAAK